MTIQTTYTQARAQLATLLTTVTNDREIVIIQRRGEDYVSLTSRHRYPCILSLHAWLGADGRDCQT